MFQYWSFWNFNWYMCAEAGIFDFNGPLKNSIINTSIIGGFMTYIHPRKIIIKYKGKKYNIPYHYMVIGDLLFHQLPLIRMIMKNPKQKLCGLYSTIPVLGWFYYNYIMNINQNKIYGIKMSYLSTSSAIITCLYGIIVHRNNIRLLK
jgi:hypothetical protein